MAKEIMDFEKCKKRENAAGYAANESDRHFRLLKRNNFLESLQNSNFEEELEKLSSELFNNIINGVKLSGYIKLK